MGQAAGPDDSALAGMNQFAARISTMSPDEQQTQIAALRQQFAYLDPTARQAYVDAARAEGIDI